MLPCCVKAVQAAGWITGDARTLDEAALARARSLAGLKGYVTNIETAVMNPGEVISR